MRMSAALLLWIAGLLTCCASQGEKEVEAHDPIQVHDPVEVNEPVEDALPAILMETSILGYSVDRRPIERWSFGTGDEPVLIIASIHGNEEAGTPLVYALARHLASNPRSLDGMGRIVIVPQANPDGVVSRRRSNSRGVDLNRNFPTSNFKGSRRHGSEPLSEPESRLLFSLIATEKPRRVISIHQMANCIDYDGPARSLAEAMSAVCELPVKRLGANPGSLGSYVGLELGLPIITLELPRHASFVSEDRLWNEYGDVLLTAIRHE